LGQALRLADLTDAQTITEPEAAAISYASAERVEPGSVVAVYDLGGGTFDAAVLKKVGTGFEIMGTPEGVEHLGGIDFDQAIFGHVSEAVGGALEELDPSDPAALQAAGRLRGEIVDAKEALSTDTEASIPVTLPNLQTQVRLTRAEFEAMIRPSITESIAALRRALASAGVQADDVSRVLLVGGSSRIPLVSEMVSAELGRPVAVDAHPKHAIPLGAALAAAGADTEVLTAADLFADEPETLPLEEAPPEPEPAVATEPRPPMPPEEKEAPPVSETKKGRTALIVAAVVLLLGAAAGGAWALGLFGGDAQTPKSKGTMGPTTPAQTSGGGGGGGDGQTTHPTTPSGCTSTSPVTVSATEYSFSPSSVTVCPGQPISFVNQGTEQHNFSIDAAGISQDLDPGGQATIGPLSDYLDPGTYPFYCQYHSGDGMTGNVTLS
jgi:plastocyanin